MRGLPDPVPARAGGGWPRGAVVRAGSMVRRRVLPRSAPVRMFGRLERKAISDGTAQATVNGAGTATVRVGPVHWGETWYPASADIATPSRVGDPGHGRFFLGVVQAAEADRRQVEAGGGDTMAW